MYTVTDNPPWQLCILLGLQQFLLMFGGTIAMPYILAPKLCIVDPLDLSQVICTGLFVAGIITLLQVTIGVRLPIVQGGTPAFIIPAFAILSLPQWQCPWDKPGGFEVENATTTMSILNDTVPLNEIWKSRMCELQGAIMIASLLQVVIGSTGLVSLIIKSIGPLVIAPTITLIALSLFSVATGLCEKNWWVAIMTMGLVILFSQFLGRIKMPCCTMSKDKHCGVMWVPVFKLFPIILAITISWSICGILTVTNAIPNDPGHWAYGSRTDGKIQVIHQAQWIRFPYPGQWGTPTFSIAGVLGMLSAVLAGIVESIGDYNACARLSGAPPPPGHAVNRGVLIEGLGCILAGAWGTGVGTTSYSENVGGIGITKVGSRRVVIYAAVIMLILGLFNKFAAFFVTIPDPIVGGVLMCTFGMIAAIGVSNLQFVDMNSSRNLFIFGFSVFFGLAISEWMKSPVNSNKIHTGNEVADQVIVILLSTGMFVGGMVAFILDNTVPKSDEEDSKLSTNNIITIEDTKEHDNSSSRISACYDLPFGMSFIKKHKWTRYIPISPTFSVDCKRSCICNKKNDDCYDVNESKEEVYKL